MSESATLPSSLPGVKQRIVADMDGVNFLTSQDVDPILDANKEAFNDGSLGYTPSRDMRKVAEIPMVVYAMYLNEKGIDLLDPANEKELRKLLNDNEWLYLRTAPGRV